MPRSSTKGTRRLPSHERRRQFVQAAMDIIRDEGPANLTTRSAAARVGVAQPTLFIHFKTKNDLLVAVVETAEKRLREGLARLDLGSKPPEVALRDLIDFHFRFIQTDVYLPKLWFSEEHQSGNAALSERFNELVAFYLGAIADIITAGRKSGVFAAGPPPQQSAQMIIAQFQGMAFRWILGGHADQLTDLIAPLTEQVLYGLTKRSG